MALNNVKKGLETAVMVGADSLARIQTGVDKVLWGKNATTYSAEKQQGPSRINRRNSKKASEQIVRDAGRASGPNPVEQAASAGQDPLAARVANIAQNPPGLNNTQQKASRDAAKRTRDQRTRNQQLLNPIDLGVFPILDTLVEADLCNIIQYILSRVGGPVPPPRKEEPNAAERTLYNIQDAAAEIQKGIDTFTSYPDRLLGRYSDTGPAVVTQEEAQNTTGQAQTQQQSQESFQQGVTPGATTSGTNTQKFNLVNLLSYIRTSLTNVLSITDVNGKAILSPQEQSILTEVPGMQNALTWISDSLLEFDKYTDYRNIDTVDFQKLLTRVNQFRQYCVLIQGMSFKDPRNLLALIPPGDVQQQADRIQQLFPVDKIMQVLKQINDAVQSFIRMAQKVQGLIQQGQFLIKIGIILVKVFKLIVSFLQKLPIPSMFTVLGLNINFANITQKLIDIADSIVEVLGQVNSLLGLVISFIRYLEVNAQQLLRRIYIILTNLQACATLKDSPILEQLNQTTQTLSDLQIQLQSFLADYDAKTDPETATFGKYKIQVIDEEVTDPSIVNNRRRGIALDANGVFVLQSDLTFATDLNIIIQEVKIKLISAGLVQPGLGQIDGDVAIISDSLTFLAENDLFVEDLNVSLPTEDLENPDTEDDNEGVGLQAFINKLNGGKKLRRRVRQRLAQTQRNFAQSLQQTDPSGRYTGTFAQRQVNEANRLEVQNLKEQINEWKKEIAVAAALPPGPANIALIRDRTKKIQVAQERLKQLGG